MLIQILYVKTLTQFLDIKILEAIITTKSTIALKCIIKQLEKYYTNKTIILVILFYVLKCLKQINNITYTKRLE